MTRSTGGYVGTLFGAYCAFVMCIAPKPAGCVQSFFEGFEDPSYQDQGNLLKKWYTPWGDPSDIVVDQKFVGGGKYSMKWTYDYQGGYACHRCHWMLEFPWPSSPQESTYVAWSFWLKGDGSQNKVYLGLLTDDNAECFMYKWVSLSDTTPKTVVVPFAQWVLWDRRGKTGDGKFLPCKTVREIWFGVRGPVPGKGTIYIDNVTFLHPAELATQAQHALHVDSPLNRRAARSGFTWDLRGQAIPRSGVSNGLRPMVLLSDPAEADDGTHMNRAGTVTRILELRR